MEPRILSDPEIAALERLNELMDEARVNPRQRSEFRGYPLLALELLEYALSRRKIRNPAAFALTRYRVRVAAGLRELELEHDHQEHDEPELDVEEIARGLELARRWNAPAAVIAGLEHELESRSNAGRS